MSLRARFEHRPGLHRPHTRRNGAIALLLAAFALWAGYSRHIPFVPRGGDVVKAEFTSATNIRGGQEVRVHGVKVGTVDSVERVPGHDTAVVKMRLTEDDRPALKRDARASIYWRTLLGRNMYIELDPGHAAAPLGSATIPASRTDSQVELDQALEPLDARGRRSLQVMLRTLRDGLADPAAPRAAIDAMAPGLRPVAPGLAALRGQRPGDLQRVVDRTAKVTAALDRHQAALGELIDNATTTLGVTAARRADLAAVVDRAPSALRDTNVQLAALRGTLDRLDPLVADLRPGARALDPAARAASPALRAATPVLHGLDPLLADLQPAVRRLRAVGRAGTPLVRELDPTVTRTRDEILPWLEGADPHTHRKVYELIGPTISFLDSLTQAFDANGHDVPFQAGSSTRALGGLLPCEALLTDPTASQKIQCQGLDRGLGELFGGRPSRRSR